MFSDLPVTRILCLIVGTKAVVDGNAMLAAAMISVCGVMAFFDLASRDFFARRSEQNIVGIQDKLHRGK